MFNKPIAELIKTRTSWRTYVPEAIDPQKKSELLHFIDQLPQTPFGGTASFRLITIPEIDPNISHQLGTYGFIRGAQHFIVGTCLHSPYDLENFAYLFEMILLKATELDWGTCWLGGTFNRTGFAESINKQHDERMPAVTPIGPIPGKRRLTEYVMRWSIKANQRKPWNQLFFSGSFDRPLTENEVADYRMVLESVRLAPSARNGQPWLIVKENSTPIEKEGALTQFRRLDLGIAAVHFDLMRLQLKITGQWNFKDPPITRPPGVIYRFSFIVQ
jgi:hypothetical protein